MARPYHDRRQFNKKYGKMLFQIHHILIKKIIINKLLTMLICIWISVSKNVMYAHACRTSQIQKKNPTFDNKGDTATSELKPRSDVCPNLFSVVAGVPACVHSITAN
jgi:hypothetical protein